MLRSIVMLGLACLCSALSSSSGTPGCQLSACLPCPACALAQPPRFAACFVPGDRICVSRERAVAQPCRDHTKPSASGFCSLGSINRPGHSSSTIAVHDSMSHGGSSASKQGLIEPSSIFQILPVEGSVSTISLQNRQLLSRGRARKRTHSGKCMSLFSSSSLRSRASPLVSLPKLMNCMPTSPLE